MKKRSEECHPDEHEYEYVDDDYGSLADGGSYEIYVCLKCGAKSYSPLPD